MKISNVYLLVLLPAILFVFTIMLSFYFTPRIYAQDGTNPPPTRTQGDVYKCSGDNDGSCLSENPIVKWINFFVNILSIIIVSGAAVMIAVAGLQYTTARDDSGAVQKAKERISNVLTALVAYFFFFVFVQWLVPGGVF